MRRLLFPLILSVMPWTLGCAGGTWFPDQQAITPRGHTLRVDNRNPFDVNVYVLRSGVTRRLGLVPGEGFASFALAEADARDGTVRLVLDPVGSSTPFVTEPIMLPRLAGGYVSLTVYRRVERSVWTVRRPPGP